MNQVDHRRRLRGGQRSPAAGAPAVVVRQRGTAGAEDVAGDVLFVSVKTLARQWDCSRTTVCRLLEQAGVEAFFLGKGRNGTKRYRKADVNAFLQSIDHC